MQGFAHLLFKHAWFLWHSTLLVHVRVKVFPGVVGVGVVTLIVVKGNPVNIGGVGLVLLGCLELLAMVVFRNGVCDVTEVINGTLSVDGFVTELVKLGIVTVDSSTSGNLGFSVFPILGEVCVVVSGSFLIQVTLTA